MTATALLLVDIQNDFMPKGALGVYDADNIIAPINALLDLPFDHIIASKDWHPSDHSSFATVQGKEPGEVIHLKGIKQVLWPVHCVQDTPGAEFAPGWDTSAVEKTFHKGTNPEVDSYSAFFDNGHLEDTGLEEYLTENDISTLFIAGLTTEYCVKYSALDALELGFDVFVIDEACCGINLRPDDSEKALSAIEAEGGEICSVEEVEEILEEILG